LRFRDANAARLSLARRLVRLCSSAMVKNSYLCLLSLMALAACQTPPPRAWLRYELDGSTQWSPLGAGKLGGTIQGVNVTIDLFDPDTRILVVVENRGEQSAKFRIGPEAGAPKDAIGEVLLRQIDGPAVGGPPMQPYVAMQPLMIDSGWRATFYLDRPLGNDLQLGQYFVLGTELQGVAGEPVRRFLPLVAKMGGTVPVKPK
jgi:hypothetical protein